MDPPEQALVQVGAAALAAPSAAVAGLVAASIAANTKRTYAAALKRLDAALAGQDLTDASLALYLARLHAAGCWPAFDGKARAGARSTGCASAKPTPRPRSASRAGYPVTVSELAAHNRWPPAGRWQSLAMPGHYARGQVAARGAVACVRYGRG